MVEGFPLGAVLGQRYRLDGLLLNNPHSQTWLATDRSNNQRVILKTAASESLAGHQIEKEIELLQSLRNRFLPRLLDYGTSESKLFLVREFRGGESLSENLRNGPMPLAQTLRLVSELLTFLKEIHEHGIIHRDLKPDNIILEGDKATVIDFGLSKMVGPSRTEANHTIVGSVRYMAPEQAGTLKHSIGPNADLFSVGCIFYECLTGTPLFSGATVREVLQQQIQNSENGLHQQVKNVPLAVHQLLSRLLEKDPRKRYQNAESVLEDVRETIWRLNSNKKSFGLSKQRHQLALSDPIFIGRKKELRQLQSEGELARQGLGQLILLEAESGGGKSRLLQEFQPRETWVLRGQGIDQSASRPFQIFNNVIEAIVSAAQLDPLFHRHLKQTMAPYAQSIVDAFPILRHVLELQSLQIVGPEELAEQRVLQACTELLGCLGQAGRPAVVVLDDVQWADELSLKLLSYWASSNKDRKSFTMIIASFRTEDVAADHSLRAVRKVKRIQLPAFSLDDISQLIDSMAGKFPMEVLDLITHLSQGNVFMACSVIHGLYESNAIRPTLNGWEVDQKALSHAQSSRKAAVFLARRLQKFPAETLRVLRIAAVLGKEFDFDLLQQLSGLLEAPLLDHLLEANVRKVIWMRTHEKKFVFAHDKIRETLLDDLSEEHSHALHLAAADAIEKMDTQSSFELAYHYSEAKQFSRAFPYAMAAANQARAQHALRLAETYFEIAMQGCKEFSIKEQIELLESSGDVYMLLGRYELARQQYDTVRELNKDRIFRSQVDGKLGELLFKQGNIQEAAIKVECGLRNLNRWVPTSNWAFLIGALWEALIQAFHTLFPLARRKKPDAQHLLALHLYSRLAYIHWFGRGALACLWSHLREMNMAERFEETREMAQAYSEHAPVMTQLPWFKRGHDYGLRSLQIRRRFGDVWGEAQSLHFLGVVLYSSTRYLEALERCRQAMMLFERTGDRWEANTASWHTAYAHYRLGNLKEALSVARHTFEAGRLIGDHHATGISLAAWSKATGGRVPEELMREELQRIVGDAHTRVELLTAEGLRLLQKKDFEQSIHRLTEAVEVFRSKGLRQEYVIPAQVWLVTALREKIISLPYHAVKERSQLMTRARREARRAVRLARFYRNNWPHALREKAWLCSFDGKITRASWLLKKSLSAAQKQRARYEEGLSLYALGEILRDERICERGNQIIAACEKPMLALLEGPTSVASAATPSLVDRFASLLDVGRKIVGAIDDEGALDEAKQGARQLLRAADCAIVPLEQGRLPSEANLSQQLFEASISRGKSECMEDFLTQDATDSLVLIGARSALYSPIYLDGQPIALLIATHQGISALFGEEEKRLADYISVLTGATLKNIERVGKIQRLSDERNELFTQAQKAIEVRDQFLSFASHELKTPLTALQLQSHLLARMEGHPSAATQFLPQLNRQLTRLNRLVDDLLDVSKLSAGKFALTDDREVMDLYDLIQELVNEHRLTLEQSHCQVEVECPKDAKVVGDRDRLVQVLRNLLMNAKKYAPGLIQISVVETPGRAIISVRDHGPGIEPQFQQIIFQRFERAPQKGPIGGLGLGLYIAREIVRSHGGELTLESSSAGSNFSFYLPY